MRDTNSWLWLGLRGSYSSSESPLRLRGPFLPPLPPPPALLVGCCGAPPLLPSMPPRPDPPDSSTLLYRLNSPLAAAAAPAGFAALPAPPPPPCCCCCPFRAAATAAASAACSAAGAAMASVTALPPPPAGGTLTGEPAAEARLLLVMLPGWLFDCWLDCRCSRCMTAGAIPAAAGRPSGCCLADVPLCTHITHITYIEQHMACENSTHFEQCSLRRNKCWHLNLTLCAATTTTSLSSFTNNRC